MCTHSGPLLSPYSWISCVNSTLSFSQLNNFKFSVLLPASKSIAMPFTWSDVLLPLTALFNSTTLTKTLTSTTPRSSNYIIGRTGNFNGEYSSKQLAFISIGDGLSSAELTTLDTLTQALQTTLVRQV